MPRPTKYKEEYIKELEDYMNVEPYKIIKQKVYSDDGEDEIEVTKEIEANDYPSYAGFALKIGVCRDTIHEWCKVHKKFSDACGRLKTVQENFLLVNGLRGNIPQNFGMFIAKNNLGYRDKQPGEDDRKITFDDITKKSDTELSDRITELLGDD